LVAAVDRRTPGAAQASTADASWLSAGAPVALRRNHTATLLSDGRVLLAGGQSGESPLASAEICDPWAGRCTATGAMIEARYTHTATLLPNGKVLVTGGTKDSSTALASAEIFDPETGTFSPAGTLSAPRRAHTATLLGSNRVLIAGGGDASTDVYDPATGTFAAGPVMTTTRTGHAAALLPSGKVLLVAGDAIGTSSTAELFDPAANGGAGSFVTTGGPTTLRPLAHTATALRDGRVLVVGSCPKCLGALTNAGATVAELFDPAANGGVGAFTQTGSLATGRSSHSATLLPSGEVLIAGGRIPGPQPSARRRPAPC
jgi:hypothetical protein